MVGFKIRKEFMQFEMIERVKKKKIIEIEFPYYYKHDVGGDYDNSEIYGKIDCGLHTSIQETKCFRDS